jgi:NADH pyrophosphatase NudC (nudix superfamily)
MDAPKITRQWCSHCQWNTEHAAEDNATVCLACERRTYPLTGPWDKVIGK